MNFAHLHFLLNLAPILGTVIGLAVFLISVAWKNGDLQRTSLVLLVAVALVALPAFFSGIGAQGAISKDPAVPPALMERHEGAAILALFFMKLNSALDCVAF